MDGVRWLEADLPGARVCFSTREGGVSSGPFESLNLGLLTGDDPGSVLANRRRLAASLGFESTEVVMARQVHGARLLEHESPDTQGIYTTPVPDPAEADGHLTSSPRLPMLVLVADCLPVAMRGPGGLAMLHCGWRGLAAGIVDVAAGHTAAETAVIGPGIGPCCYEVDDELLRRFASLGNVTSGRHLDLPAVAVRLLEAAGVGRIEQAGICTSCEQERFFSYRRDHGRTGRQAGIAWIL